MSWAEIKKAINSDLSKPLNVKISELKDFLSGELFPVTRTTGKVIEVFNHPSDIYIYNNRSNAEVCLAKFIAPKSGIYRYDADIIGNDNISAMHIISKLRSNSGIYYSGSAVTHYGLVPNYSKTAIGGYVYWGDTTSHPNSYTVEQVFQHQEQIYNDRISAGQTVKVTGDIFAAAGEPVIISGFLNNTSYYSTVKNQYITYRE